MTESKPPDPEEGAQRSEPGQGIVGRARDIAERARSEEALRAVVARYERIIANTPGMVYQYALRPDGSFVFPFVSEGCRELFDVPPERICDQPACFIQAVHPDDRASVSKGFRASAASLEPFQWEGRILQPGPRAQEKWVKTVARPERQLNGDVLWDGVLIDVTERRRAQEALRQREEVLRAVGYASERLLRAESLEQAIGEVLAIVGETLGAERAWLFETCPEPDNPVPALKEVARWTAPDAEGGAEAGPVTLLPEVFAPWQEPLSEGYVIGGLREDFCGTPAGLLDSLRLRTFLLAPLLLDGLCWGFLCVGQDQANENWGETEGEALKAVSDSLSAAIKRRAGEEALRAAKEEAERANLAKSEFLSRMSHELRTPLNAILGFGQLLAMEDLNPRQNEGVEHILKGGRHLLGLINEVLDIARVEAGHLNVSIEPVRLGDVLAEALSLIRPLAAQRRIRIDDTLAQSVSDTHVLADHQRLRQVLLNLLSNAVKYNRDAGSITLSGEPRLEERLRLTVADTGPGISPQGLERLFTPFERLGAERNGVEGSGLGLALSKRLIELMNGGIGVESEPGQGSAFWVELPLAKSRTVGALRDETLISELARTTLSSGAPKTILYIEDNLCNLQLIERILEGCPKIRLLSAMQGSLGLELAREHRPELILLDLQLPDLSGDKVLARLRAEPATAAIPVVMISADATPGQIERLLAAGALTYLTKPLDVHEFLRVVDRGLNDGAPEGRLPAASVL